MDLWGKFAHLLRGDERGALAIEFGVGVLLIGLLAFVVISAAGLEITELFPRIELPHLSLGF
jgi:Flp pilus assembly pilin Flp